jgi:hypothetical protein
MNRIVLEKPQTKKAMKANSSFQKKRPSWPVFLVTFPPWGGIFFSAMLRLQPQLQVEDLSGPEKKYKDFLF